MSKYAWFAGHMHRNHVDGIYNGGGCKLVETESCKEVDYGIARLVQVYSDGHVEMSLIYGASSARKVTSADTTVYENRTKVVSMQSAGAEK